MMVLFLQIQVHNAVLYFFRQYFFTAIKLNAYCNKASREILLKLARLKTKNRLVCHNGSELFLKNNLVYSYPFNFLTVAEKVFQFKTDWVFSGFKKFEKTVTVSFSNFMTIKGNTFMNIRGCQINSTGPQYFQKLSLTKISYIISFSSLT